MISLANLQRQITACTGIAFSDVELLLADESEQAKRVALALAGQAETDEKAFALLAQMVYHMDNSVRILACLTLACFRERFDDAVYDLVRRLAREREEEVAQQGAYALGNVAGHRDDARTYVWLLCSGDWWELRLRGVSALAMMVADPKARQQLAKMLREDGSTRVRRAAAGALSKAHALHGVVAYQIILDSLGAIKWRGLRTILAQVTEPTADQVLDVLASLSQSGNTKVREIVARSLQALVRTRPEPVKNLVLTLLDDSDYSVRDGAICCLEMLCEAQDESHFSLVADLATKKSARLREAAARALGHLHPRHGREAWSLLERLAEDEDQNVRCAVAVSLGSSSQSFRAQSLMIAGKLARDKSKTVQADVLGSIMHIAKFDSTHALDLVVQRSEEKNSQVRQAMALCLVSLSRYKPRECFPLTISLAHKDDIPQTARNAGAALESVIDFQPQEGLELIDHFLRAQPQPAALEWLARMGRLDEIAQTARCYLELWRLAQGRVRKLKPGLVFEMLRQGEQPPRFLLIEPAPIELSQSLAAAIASLSQLPDRVAHKQEVAALLELARFCLDCRSVADFTLSKAWETFESLREPFLLAEFMTFGRQLAAARDQISEYKTRPDQRDREILLIEAQRILDQAEAYAAHNLYPPYQELAQRIAAYWYDLVNAARKNLRGRAVLRLRLLSDQLPFGTTVDVGLSVYNLGDEIAEQVTLRMADSADYKVIYVDPPLDHLVPGASATWRCTLGLYQAKSVHLSVAVTHCQRDLETPQTSEFAEVLTFFDQEQRYPYVPLEQNPYVTGRPLQTDDVFFGRIQLIADIAAALRRTHQDNVIVLYGQRRIGKTSLLYALQRYLPKERYVTVLYDAAGVSSPLSLFWGLANCIHDAFGEAGLFLPEPARRDFLTEAEAQFEHGFLRYVRRLLGRRRMVLLIDEFEALEEAVKQGRLTQNVFPFFRHLMRHQQQFSFIFCGTHQVYELTRSYWEIFYNAALPRRVSFLGEESTLALIKEPVRGHFSYDELALKTLFTLTGGHPFFTQLLCHSLVRLAGEQKRGYITSKQVDDVSHQLIQAGLDHLDYVWEQSNPTEKALLLALTNEVRRQQRAEIQWDSVVKHVDKHLSAGRIAAERARTSLQQRELITNDGPRLRFTMGLIPAWLSTRHDWSGQT